MASSYTHSTALKIYATIAADGEDGVDIDQLTERSGLAGNTLRIYARWLAEDGAIDIQAVHSKAANRPLKNLYVAIREPRPRLTERERLKQIAVTLEPFSRHPQSWHKGYKGEIIHAIDEALKLTG